MKVKDLKLVDSMRKHIRIIKVNSIEDKYLEGLTGTLTNPFGCFMAKGVGIFLDKPIASNLECKDICNLETSDEIEFIGEGD